MSPHRNLLALAIAMMIAAACSLATPASARDADQVFRFTAPSRVAIEAGVWLPDAAAFPGPRPLVVISHGNGGAFSGHHDTAESLAKAGFVVAALTHPGDNWRDASRQTQLSDRPQQVSWLIDHMTQKWSGPVTIDPARIGAFGFSAGGYTVTALVGGISDPQRIASHCQAQAQSFVCRLLAQSPIDTANWRPVGADTRIKAAVIAAPGLGFAFTDDSLAAVTTPIQLWAGETDEVVPAPFNAEAIRDHLGRRPEYHLVPGASHFDFLPPCSPALVAALPQLCQSRPGFDRAAFHQDFNDKVVGYFQAKL